MPRTRYLRLEEDIPETNSNGYVWALHDVPESEDLSLEPTAHNGTLRLAEDDDVNILEPGGGGEGEGEGAGQDEGDAARKSGCCYWYAKFVDRFPVLFCLVLLAVTAGGGAVALTLYDIPSFDDPLKGFEARQTVIRDRLSSLDHFNNGDDTPDFHHLSWQPPGTTTPAGQHQTSTTGPVSLMTDYVTSATDILVTTGVFVTNATDVVYLTNATASTGTVGEDSTASRTTVASSTSQPITLCQEPDNAKKHLRLVFSKVGLTELLSKEGLLSMCQLYADYVLGNNTNISPYVRSCEPASLGMYAAVLDGKQSCFDITENSVTSLRQLLSECAPFYLDGTLTDDCRQGQCPGVPGSCAVLDAVYDIFHYLLPSGSASQIDQGNFQAVKYALMVTPLWEWDSVPQSVYKDHIMGRSITDGVTALCAVGSSFKFDLFSDFLISDFKFMALGIGLILIIIWLYTGSLFITLMTILDMVMSLILSYFLYIVVFKMPFFPFINVLAIILVIGIGADDAFVYVDIWKKMREKHGEGTERRVVVLQETLHHAGITMFVTSFTTASALFSSVISSITAMRCLAVYAGCAVLLNFVYTVTWLPAIVIIEDKYLQFRRCRRRIPPNRCYTSFKNAHAAVSNGIRSFWEKTLPAVVFKLRYMWLLLFTLLGIGGACAIFVLPKLQLPSKTDFQVFVSSDYLEQYDDKYKQMFEFEVGTQELMPIYYIWGVEPVDNGNPWDPDSEGTLVVDQTFLPSSPGAQEWLMSFCIELRNQSFYSRTGKSDEFCFIDILQSVMQTPCRHSPLSDPCCSQSEFPYDEHVFEQCSRAFLEVLGLESFARFGKQEHWAGLMLAFTSTTADTIVYENMSNFWYTIDTWSKEKMKTAPAGMRGGWFVSATGDQMYFYDLQESLARGTPISIGLSLGMGALVLLLSTRNLLLTLYAMLSISCTVFVTIGSLVLLGWELNILESTVMSLAVGLSVDFTIHYGVAYRIAPQKDRGGRSGFAMSQLSCAITTAALSTFIAGAVMLPSSVLCYQQIGIFMTLVMGVSWFYSNFYFMALCRAWGPEGNCTQIPALSCGAHCGATDGSNSCCCCQRQDERTVLDQRVVGDIDLGYVAEY